MRIKNIIFDLGGVLLNIDYHAAIRRFKALGMEHFDALYNQASQTDLFDRFDRGEVSPAGFRQALRDLSGLPLTDGDIDAAWNAMLLDFPASRLELLEKAGRHYRLFLLSNTNAIHYPVYLSYMRSRFGLDGLGHVFEKEYLSYRIGMRKPEHRVYECILKENGLKAQQTLFIDDSIQHVEGARQAGLHAVHLEVPSCGVEGLFDARAQLLPAI